MGWTRQALRHSAFLRWLHRRGELEAVPAFPKITPRRHTPTIITPDDQDAVLAEIPLEGYARTHFGYFEEASIYEINYAELEDWDGWLASKGLSAKTRRNILGAFSAFLHWLHRRGELEAVPAFPKITPRRHTPTIITPEDQDAVLAW